MAKIGLGNGKWFDTEKAEAFSEHTYGSNNISVATGSQWYHEMLYKTAGGKWVLNSWSNYDNIHDSYEIIGEEEAIEWLVANQHGDYFPSDQEI